MEWLVTIMTHNNPNTFGFKQIGSRLRLKSAYGIALYDVQNGKIHHLHYIINMGGSVPVDTSAIEKKVLVHAERLGHDIKTLKILHIPDIKPYGNYKVDVKNQTLIELPQKTFNIKHNRSDS
jgi:hypothetical protein